MNHIEIDDKFVNAESMNISFSFQCVSMEQDPPQTVEGLEYFVLFRFMFFERKF